MFRALFTRPFAAPAQFLQRTYVTKRQLEITKQVAINPRNSIPEPVISTEDRARLRADPLLSQLVNTIMRDGKKLRAERFVQEAMLDIRAHTNSDPYKVVQDAVELAAPVMDTKSGRQGSKVIQIPRPLNLRQRRRRAIVWILDSVKKRNERKFHMRLSGELQAIINGTSGVLEKKLQLHKMVLANRSNIKTSKRF
ncbi:ribosomal protein S7 [Linderina pennispora]|uniref:Ribosomal protein S7 n=1 Tax=Linderina pennispora TaxID=61395 RepID=A0A1Y1WM73_9FUNG|nr:ribosomal protein S7 [Linderina pennispora]ORX74296.1 ribosomal protein S7 [Linderina pennispora]